MRYQRQRLSSPRFEELELRLTADSSDCAGPSRRTVWMGPARLAWLRQVGDGDKLGLRCGTGRQTDCGVDSELAVALRFRSESEELLSVI